MIGVLMNTHKLLLPAAFLAIAISPSTVLAGPKDVPFKASVASQEILANFPQEGVCAGSFAKGTTAVIGKASHLGRVSGAGTDCINISDNGSPPSFAFTNGELELTAANGDKLTFSYSGDFKPTNFPVYAITGTYKVTGGTGRFVHASGEGVLDGTENIQTLQGQLEFIGKISY
jgi:hypothetical protein